MIIHWQPYGAGNSIILLLNIKHSWLICGSFFLELHFKVPRWKRVSTCNFSVWFPQSLAQHRARLSQCVHSHTYPVVEISLICTVHLCDCRLWKRKVNPPQDWAIQSSEGESRRMTQFRTWCEFTEDPERVATRQWGRWCVEKNPSEKLHRNSQKWALKHENDAA